jgi:thiamine-phosphate pyrophosphorylase
MPVPGRLYLLFTPELCRAEPLDTLEAALRGGVDMVQWRSPRADRATFEGARSRCQAHGAPLLVNDDVMLALRADCDGAHVGQEDMDADAARKLMFGRMLGVSTHDLEQVRAAAAARADYVGFGPCFATATKGYQRGLDHDQITAAAERCGELQLPMFAIGGLTPDNLPALAASGVRRAAVSSYVLQHEDPADAARRLRAALR